jgi:arylsulfatase A-like enzyme/Flp pilus assembly protein TadD
LKTATRIIALLLLALCGCGGSRTASPRVAEGTPVLLISIDTLRSDRLPAYGYGGVQTPAIDRLARDGVLFERVFSHVPLTLPSHASILTGLLPPDHGVRNNSGYTLSAEKLSSLPGTLSELGYATGGTVSSFVLRRSTGIAAGFDFYDDDVDLATGVGLGGLERSGDKTLERALSWLRTVADRPFFLFFHIFEPHAPYEPPEPFASRYGDPYDGEVAAADRVVGELLAELDRLQLYDRALIILLSDHGEGLGDHGEREHGLLLYREALQVPLLIKLPGAERGGSRVAETAQLVDLFPTLLSLLGQEIPRELPGRPLLAPRDSAEGERTVYSETLYPRIHFGWSELASMVRWPYHYIEGPDPELYELEADPGERHDRIDEEPAARRALAVALAGIDRTAQPPGAVDAETREKLASLGYVGGAMPQAGGELPDPKGQLHVLEELRAAMRKFAEEDYGGAAEAFREIVSLYPGMLDAWNHLGTALERDGREEEAIEAYREGLRICGGCNLLALPVARLYLRAGRLEEARGHAELGLEADPPTAYGLLAEVARRRGELDEAESLARQALGLNPRRPGPMLTLADVLLARERFREALDWGERARQEFEARETRDPRLIQGLYFLIGQAHARLGDGPEAEQAFLTEIRLFPEEAAPYTHLAVLYALVGDAGRAGAVLQRLVEMAPTAHGYAEAVKTWRALGNGAAARDLLREGLARHPDAPELRSLARPSS